MAYASTQLCHPAKQILHTQTLQIFHLAQEVLPLRILKTPRILLFVGSGSPTQTACFFAPVATTNPWQWRATSLGILSSWLVCLARNFWTDFWWNSPCMEASQCHFYYRMLRLVLVLNFPSFRKKIVWCSFVASFVATTELDSLHWICVQSGVMILKCWLEAACDRGTARFDSQCFDQSRCPVFAPPCAHSRPLWKQLSYAYNQNHKIQSVDCDWIKPGIVLFNQQLHITENVISSFTILVEMQKL